MAGMLEKHDLGAVILDLLQPTIDQLTVIRAARIVPFFEFDFLAILAGAPEDVDYTELGKLAREELARELMEVTNGIDHS